MIFTASKDLKHFQKVSASNFVALNVWERQHIEEWLRTTPEVLGEELLILSTEFDRFQGSNDRLDLLALDRKGNLVVIELKRDVLAAYADLQSIRYAAMISAMTIEKLLPYYIAYRVKYHGEHALSQEEARIHLIEFVEVEEFREFSNRPRIILCSQDFSSEVTTTVLWLRQFGVDVSCVKITPYQLNDQIVIVPDYIIPLQEARQYLVDIQQKEDKQTDVAIVGERAKRSMRVLLDNNLVAVADPIHLTFRLPSHIAYDANDLTFQAEITGKTGRSNAVRWAKDGQEYAISTLTWNIFKRLHPDNKDPGGVNGNVHWTVQSGRSLWDLAQEHQNDT